MQPKSGLFVRHLPYLVFVVHLASLLSSPHTVPSTLAAEPLISYWEGTNGEALKQGFLHPLPLPIVQPVTYFKVITHFP